MAAQFELHEEDAQPSPVAPTESSNSNRPACCLVVGMAGAGKTTLMQRLNHYALEQEQAAGSSVDPTYYVNMDPAVTQVPFAAGIDIRDTVDYKQVMKQYNLGPNGGIMTSLNLFATRFDQVLRYTTHNGVSNLLRVIFSFYYHNCIYMSRFWTFWRRELPKD